MARLLFEKTGRAIWISHLDLMRLFQRAFKRAGLPLKHTQGFNPRPSVSIALPLSVGVESYCELLDFDLDGIEVPTDEITHKLNKSLVEGVRVRQTYAGGRKLKDLALLSCTVRLSYNDVVSPDRLNQISNLFQRDSLSVKKRSKNGLVEQDIIPLIHELHVSAAEHDIVMDAVIHCQNPSMNPMQLAQAVQDHLPGCIPEQVFCCRNELFDNDKKIFR